MSRIAFTGNALGTGTVTLASPNTNTDRTVTLPDTTGTLYISGGDIGTPSAGNASNLTNLNASNLSTGTVPDARFPATLPAASGANLTSLNGSNISTGTVAPARLGSGTPSSSNYLRGDGSWQPAGGQGGRGQVFTGNGTFTIPTGITAVKVTVVGGGGGGNSALCQSNPGGGGATGIKFLTSLTPGATLSVVIGGGGNGTNVSTAGTGGTSSVSSGTQSITTISASGGLGAANNAVIVNGGSSISGADLSMIGSPGRTNGAGGRSMMSGAVGSAGGPGALYGGGGLGDLRAGAAGVVIFEW